MKFPFFRKKPELERHVKREVDHRDLHAPDFLHTQAMNLEAGVFNANGVISITRSGHSPEFERTYWLEKIGKRVFFNCNNQPPQELKRGVHYLFGNEGLVLWAGKKREKIPTSFMGINLGKVAPIESVFFIDNDGVVHLKRFNKGWQDEVKTRIIVKVSESFYKSQAATLASRVITNKLGEFKNESNLQIGDSFWPFNSNNADMKRGLFSGLIRDIEGVYKLEINGHRQELRPEHTYVFGKFGLFEINTYTATENNISKFVDTLPEGIRKSLSAIESIFTIKGGKIYFLSY